MVHLAEKVAKELLPIIDKEPSLRPGSYASSMEEVGQDPSLG